MSMPDITPCARAVERGDPDRFLAVMAAPPPARAKLFPLYAFNLEVARAPWLTQETMIAEMRLQWWRDALAEIAAGQPVRPHEVTTPLAAAITPAIARALDALIEARRWDIYRDPFGDEAAFTAHLDATSGTLLWAAAASLGPADEATCRDAGYALGLANWFRAIPDLQARGRIPLVDGTPKTVARLARDGLARLARARARRGTISKPAAPAMLACWDTGAILTRAAHDPAAVAEGRLGRSPARTRLALMLRAASGVW